LYNLLLLAETYAQLHKHSTASDDFEDVGVGKVKRQVSLLAENDARYAGRRVSRRYTES